MRIHLLIGLSLSLVAADVQAQTVHVVGQPGGFTNLASAVAAANAGDTVLLFGDDPGGFTVDKPLSIIGDAGAGGGQSVLDAPLNVENIPAGTSLLLQNLRLPLSVNLALLGGGPFFEVRNCAGTVTFQDCVVAPTFASFGLEVFQVSDCAAVVFVDCSVESLGFSGAGFTGLEGHGVKVSRSSIYAYGSNFVGGTWRDQLGAGMFLDASFAYLEDVALSGADSEAFSVPHGIGCGRVGGAGIELVNASRVVAVSSTMTGGVDRTGGRCTTTSTISTGPASIVDASSTLEMRSRQGLRLDATALAREGQMVDYQISGQPGDAVALAFAVQADAFWFPLIDAPLIVGTQFVGVPLGVLPASGLRIVNTTVPSYPAGIDVERYFLQALAIRTGASGPQLIGGAPRVVTLLDAAF